MIPCYIIARDRYTMTRNLADSISRLDMGCPIIVDNASKYPPLLDWYERCPFQVVRLKEHQNSHRSPWNHVIPSPEEFVSHWGQPYYVVTDHDLDISDVPPDVLRVLEIGIQSDPQWMKCGLSLDLSNVHADYRETVLRHEQQFWRGRVVMAGRMPYSSRFYEASIDTTFALYDIRRGSLETVCRPCCPALRSARPYTARHIPWERGPEQWDEEDRYYYSRIRPELSWSVKNIPAMNISCDKVHP